MPIPSASRRPFLCVASCCIAVIAAVLPVMAGAHGADASAPTVASSHVPRAIAVRKALPPPAGDVAELKFQDIYRLPVGTHGLVPTELARGLDGRRVRMVGYVVRRSDPASDRFILAPMPVGISDEDESHADDLPASAVLVRLGKHAGEALPNIAGLVQVTGTLRLQPVEDPSSQRVFGAAIDLDDRLARVYRGLARKAASATHRDAP